MIPQNLNPRQLEAATYSGGPLLIAAGAGSGKTKTLTSRLLFLLDQGAPPHQIIAITFTNKAAKEMADRISAALGRRGIPAPGGAFPFIGTFHSLGARILKNEAGRFKRTANYTIFDSDDSSRLMKGVVKELGIKRESAGPAVFLHAVSRIKNELLDPDLLPAADKERARLTRLAYEAYESRLLENNAFDFDDLIEKPVRLFRESLAALEKYREKFQYILVDEFQDINTSQYQFIRELAAQHKNISVVGDDQQSIYSFRGSDFRNFLNFERDWEGAKVVLLEENYRSTANIVRAASAVIKENKVQQPKELWTRNEPGNLVRVIEHEDEEREASWIADQIRALRALGESESIAILYRTNAQSRSIEQAMIERNIPYQIYGGVRFYERKEIKDLVAALRYAFNQKDSVSAERLEKNFPKAMFRGLIAALPEKAGLPPSEAIGFVLASTNYFEYLKRAYSNHEERAQNIAELISFASGYEGLGEFLEKVTLLQASDTGKGRTGKNIPFLMTVHIAKGLEFDTVFVAGAAEGLLPHQMSWKGGEREGVEEERRLMYVAMTRARKNLYLNFYDLGSRFLYEIPPELIEFQSFAGKSELIDDEERYISLD